MPGQRRAAEPKRPADQGMRLSLLYHLFTADRAAATLVASTLDPEVADGYAVMSLIRLEGPKTPSALAEQVGMLLTTTSALIERMARRGHVTRIPHPEDGRSYLVGLTPAGEAAHRKAMPVFTGLMQEILAELEHLPDEIADALKDLEQAIRRVQKRHRDT